MSDFIFIHIHHTKAFNARRVDDEGVGCYFVHFRKCCGVYTFEVRCRNFADFCIAVGHHVVDDG